MKIKPRKIKLEEFAVVYRGDGEYAICAGVKTNIWGEEKMKWYGLWFNKFSSKHTHNIDEWHYRIVGEGANSKLSELNEKMRNKAKAAYYEMKHFEERRVMIEELGVIVPPDKIIYR